MRFLEKIPWYVSKKPKKYIDLKSFPEKKKGYKIFVNKIFYIFMLYFHEVFRSLARLQYSYDKLISDCHFLIKYVKFS